MTEPHAPREHAPRRRDLWRDYTLIASVLTLVLKQFNVIPPSVGIQQPPPSIVLTAEVREEIRAEVSKQNAKLDNSLAGLSKDVQDAKIDRGGDKTALADVKEEVKEVKVEVKELGAEVHRRPRGRPTDAATVIAFACNRYGRMGIAKP